MLPLTTGITSPGGGSGVTRKTWLKVASTKAPKKKKKKKTTTKPKKKTSSKKSTTKTPKKTTKEKAKKTENSKTGGSLKQKQETTDGNTNQTGKTVGKWNINVIKILCTECCMSI